MLMLPGRPPPPLPAIVGAAIDATSSIVTIASVMVVSKFRCECWRIGWLPLPLPSPPVVIQSNVQCPMSNDHGSFDLFDLRRTSRSRRVEASVGLRGACSLLQLEPYNCTDTPIKFLLEILYLSVVTPNQVGGVGPAASTSTAA